jgi:transposase InsO family protein
VTATQLVAIQSRLAAELDRFSVRRTRHSQFIRTLRRELLDHVIVLNQAHLERLLREFIEDYYHTARPHQGLAGETPVPQAPPGEGELISVPVVGGLHHRYYRAAA